MPMLNSRMVHDFLITEKYAIIPDLPIEFDPKKAIKENTFAFTYNKQGGARYGIFPRDSKDGKDIKWFDVDPHYVFHFGNTWNAVNADGDDIVIVYAIAHEEIDLGV